MFRKILLPLLLVIVCFGCSKKGNNNSGGGNTNPPNPIDTNTGKPNNEHISVFTQHNDNSRAGLLVAPASGAVAEFLTLEAGLYPDRDEHFGFSDGVAQPVLAARSSADGATTATS